MIEPNKELLIMRYLYQRQGLSQDDENHYHNIEKGFEGERQLYKKLDSITNELNILHDLYFEQNKSPIQIDFLLLTHGKPILIEVKNFEGEYFIKEDRWYKLSGKEIKNPLIQLQRTETNFRQLLTSYNFNNSFESYIVFVNPQFTLLTAPINKQIILPTQLPRFIKYLSCHLSNSAAQSSLYMKLISMNMIESRRSSVPAYLYENLCKGVNCSRCGARMMARQSILYCGVCGYEEKVEKGILRSIKELELLFPNKKITTNLIFDWCGEIVSSRRTQKVLNQHFVRLGHNKASHYIRN